MSQKGPLRLVILLASLILFPALYLGFSDPLRTIDTLGYMVIISGAPGQVLSHLGNVFVRLQWLLESGRSRTQVRSSK